MLPFVSKESNFKNLFRLSLVVTIVILLSQFLNPFLGTLLVFLLTIFATSRLFLANENIQTHAIVAILFVGFTPFYLILRGFVTRSVLNSWDLQFYSILFYFSALVVNFFVGNKKSNLIENNFLPNQKKIFFAFGSLWVGLLTYWFLVNKSLGRAVAWAASGDSKNHLVNGVSITQYGFLDPTTFYTQPVSSPSFLALVLSQGGQNLSTNMSLLEYQMEIYAFVWILLIGILGFTFAGICQFVWSKIQNKKSEVPDFVLFVVSCLPTFSYLLGSALFDGFFTAIFGISTVVLLITWYLEQSELKSFSLSNALTGIAIFVTSVLAWMFVAPFSFAILMLGLQANSLKSRINKNKITFFLLLFVFSLPIAIHFSEFGQQLIRNIKLALNTPGAANVNNPNYFYISILSLILIGLIFRSKSRSLSNSLITLAVIQIGVLTSFKFFSNLNLFGWNYYLLKYQWIMFTAVTAVLISALIAIMYNLDFSKKKLNTVSFSILILTFYLFSESIVGVNKVHQKILGGWDNPRAVTLDKMFEKEINNKIPTMFFHFGYAGESRMANFWLTAFANPIEPLKGWNYTIDTTGDPMQLCSVNDYYPALTIVTSDYSLEESLAKLCPEEKFIVELEPPLFPSN